jgi:uncharacterized phage protein gp47/JayE
MALPTTGYSAKRLADWQADLRDDFRSALDTVTPGFGGSVNLGEGSVLGNLLDAFAARLDEMAEASQDLFDSFDERNSTGVYLENLARLVGLSGKTPARYSTVTLTLTATGACTVPSGSIVADAAGQQWVTQANVVFAGAGTLTVPAQPPVGAVGPIPAAAGSLTVIVTPVTGWAGVTNAADATPGRLRETDGDLRSRRRQSLQISGASAPDAIRAKVLELEGIDACKVFDNKTLQSVVIGSTTTLTLPAKSFGVVVAPNGLSAGTKAAVGAAIWASAPAGIQSARMNLDDSGTGGGVTKNVTDDSGLSQSVNFSTAVDRSVTFTVTVVDGDVPAADSDIQDVFESYVLGLSVGENPIALPLYVALGALDGVVDVTALTITGTVDTLEKAVFGGVVITHA